MNKPFNPAALLSPDEIPAYLSDALDDDDPQVFIAALGNVARAQGISHIAEHTGLGRESLYKSLSGNSEPRWDTVIRVLRAMGLRLRPERGGG
ncbi:unnamed protein product [Cyprideis torosa]|uniref:Uncharacterized protein n=1 Tax=Cyprideis torosa TaxID=163714 RepID=A0A7R8WWD3_9CRUS|nr:unnamed protein product [Cyprideis torosa]CAG0908217.1 unnamed protein product [Cyprideis torosa]